MKRKTVYGALRPGDWTGIAASAMVIADMAQCAGARPDSITIARAENSLTMSGDVRLEYSWRCGKRKGPVARADESVLRGRISDALGRAR